MRRVKSILRALRSHAIASTLFRATTLRKAVEKLGFVQADPIRSPARAQDLILRHRAKEYRAGDLEAQYPKLDLEEDFLYAYGFMPRSTWRLLHPRISQGLSASEKRVLEMVPDKDYLHPRELDPHPGRKREINAWGGYSKATTRALQSLHYRGLLRIAGRENGIRLYQRTPLPDEQEPIEPAERLRRLILLVAEILSPVPERSLRATLQHLAHAAPRLEGRHSSLTALIETGELESTEADGIRYLWPARRLVQGKAADHVRFLAPFDPLVWDRRRFEHFWGWAYRFEAYTPVAKRKLGYYAMPLLWREEVIGWVNISGKADTLNVESGFVRKEPQGREFGRAFEEEVERFRLFLRPRVQRAI